MENMCPIFVHINTLNLFTINVSTQMLAAVNNKTFFSFSMSQMGISSTI